MITPYIPEVAFAPARQLYRIGLLFTHKNGDFGANSVTERLAGLENGASHTSEQGSKLRLIRSPMRLTFCPFLLVATLATRFFYDLDLD